MRNSLINVQGFTDEQKKANAVGSIGRTPLIRVELRDNNGTPNNTTDDKVISVGYIKFKITAPETPKWTSPFDYENYYYGCTSTVKKLTWHAIETKLLEDMNIQMSEQEFDAYYKLDASSGAIANQYMNTGRVDVNGQPIFAQYPFPEVLGTITEIRNNGAESTDVFKWEIDTPDFEIFRDASYSDGVVTSETNYETVITYTRYVKYVPKNSSINHGVALEPIYLPMKVTLKYPKGELGNKLAAYWYDTNSLNAANNKPGSAMKEIHLNVEVPGTTVDGKPADCDFINDLDDAFMKNETQLHAFGGGVVNDNAPTFNVKDAANFAGFVDTELTYFYYFTAANAGRTVTGNSGMTYTLSVDDTTPIRYNNWGALSEAHNTKLYASTVQIAEIDPATGKITYLNNATAKDILNRPEVLLPTASTDRLTNALTIELGVAAFNQCKILLPRRLLSSKNQKAMNQGIEGDFLQLEGRKRDGRHGQEPPEGAWKSPPAAVRYLEGV